MRPTLALLTSLSLLLASCGGGDADPKSLTDSALEALGSADYEAALGDFEAALAAIGDASTHAQFKRAKLGYFEALAAVDADRCKDEFLAYSEAGELGAGDFSQIAGRLVSSGGPLQAVDVMHAGKTRFPDNEGLQGVLEALIVRAAQDDSVGSALASLGYM